MMLCVRRMDYTNSSGEQDHCGIHAGLALKVQRKHMLGEVIAKRAVKFVLANLILFSAGVTIGAEPIQACRNGATRGCSAKGVPGQQMCDGGVWTACAPLPPALPNPVVAFAGTEKYQVNG